jgi:TolB protein
LLKQDYIVIGRIKDAGNGMVPVKYELWDVNKQQSLLGKAMHQRRSAICAAWRIRLPTPSTRRSPVCAALSGRALPTSPRWARAATTTYSLIVADSDGFNPQVVARSQGSAAVAAWSPDGKRIAYVSFESGNSAIYIQDITTGCASAGFARPRASTAPGLVAGRQQAGVSLSFSGNLNIYVLDLASRQETRLTSRILAINTEPVWSPDGQSIYFTSDRSGRPQIYQTSASGGGSPAYQLPGSEQP